MSPAVVQGSKTRQAIVPGDRFDRNTGAGVGELWLELRPVSGNERFQQRMRISLQYLFLDVC
jgi:hypothetical protein